MVESARLLWLIAQWLKNAEFETMKADEQMTVSASLPCMRDVLS